MQSMISSVEEMRQRLQQKTSRIAVIGLGHAGLPLLCAIAASGFLTLGIDKSPTRVSALASGKSPIVDVPDELLQELLAQERLEVSTSYSGLQTCDVSIICVPTPMKDQQPDLSAIVEVAEHIRSVIPDNHLVILESTTYPGTTEEVLRPLLEIGDRRVGENLFVAYSPERVDPGNTSFHVQNTPKLVGGITPACTELTRILFESIIDNVVAVSSPAVAEAAKVLENTFRLVNIGLVNEFSLMCNQMNLNVWEVIRAAATKPYGFTPFWPGPGVGGHCIPVDPVYLSWKARQHGTVLRIVEMARDTNESMPAYVGSRIAGVLNNAGIAMRHATVLVLGVAYKPDVPDSRESPVLPLMRDLSRRGAHVQYHDPLIRAIDLCDQRLQSVDDLDEALTKADLVVVATHHSVYAWHEIEQKAVRIFDTRGIYYGVGSEKVTLL